MQSTKQWEIIPMAIIILARCRPAGVSYIFSKISWKGAKQSLQKVCKKWLKWCQVAQTRAKAPQTGSQWKWRLGRISRLKTGKSASRIIQILLQRLSSRLLAQSIKIILDIFAFSVAAASAVISASQFLKTFFAVTWKRHFTLLHSRSPCMNTKYLTNIFLFEMFIL